MEINHYSSQRMFLFEFRPRLARHIPTYSDHHVTPIFKKGSKADPGNYRPVSLTSVCCKLLESILRDEMMDHLLANNLLNKSQNGFTPGKSCCTNLLEFLKKQRRLLMKASLLTSSSCTLLRPLIKCQGRGYWRSLEHMVSGGKPWHGSGAG
jgi:hypothetical protein